MAHRFALSRLVASPSAFSSLSSPPPTSRLRPRFGTASSLAQQLTLPGKPSSIVHLSPARPFSSLVPHRVAAESLLARHARSSSTSRVVSSGSPPLHGPSSPPKKKKKEKATRLLTARNLLLLSISGLALYYWDNRWNERTLARNARTVYNGVLIGLDYKFNFDRDSLESINALHERAAARLLNVCEKNGGLYVKLGQAIGVQAAILPKPYRRLSKLFDDAEHVPWPVVERTLETEFGRPLSEVFESIDEVPVAAASVAQVHHALLRTPDGRVEEVAVKVQRPDIRRHAQWDLWAYRTLMFVYEHVFEIPLSFAAQYISDQVEQETFFDIEAANSERIRNHVLSDPNPALRDGKVYVPKIYPDLCTPRVITMEWIDGACTMTDRAAIEGMGLDVKAVVTSVCEVFAAQIFQYGFVQADGHPANILVRRHPNGKKGHHQVVLIDHGLYVSLDPAFRRTYSSLWRAIFVQDLRSVERICASWGVGNAELFASVTLLRPWQAKETKEKRKMEEEEAGGGERMQKTDLELQREMKEKIKTFLTNVELIPKPLIFVSRSMRIIQANNQVLGSPVNRINILARHAADGYLQTSDTPRSSQLFWTTETGGAPHQALRTRLKSWFDDRLVYFRFRFTLLVIDVAFYASNWIAWFRRWWYGGGREGAGRGGFEDDLEKSLQRMARSEFGVDLDDSAFLG